jgi:hypothetical protein
MSLTALDTFERLNGHPCSLEQLLQEFGKLKKLLMNAENGLIPGFGGGGTTLPIGTVLMWAGLAANIPAGWAIMNGVDNAAGSGIDMSNRFPKGRAAPYTPPDWPDIVTGGNTTYAVTGTITGGGSTSTSLETDSYSGTTDSSNYATTSLILTLDLSDLASDPFTVPAHPEHHHHVPTDEVGDALEVGSGSIYVVNTASTHGTGGGGTTLVPTSGTYTDSVTPPDDGAFYGNHEETSAVFTSATAYSCTTTIDPADFDHAHTYSGITDGHAHTIDTSGLGVDIDDITSVEPPFAELIFIERIS